MESDQSTVDPTYGERAPKHLTSITLTAAQHKILEPRVREYIKLDGAERAAYVLKSFELAWQGDEIEWGTKSLWPTKQENPRWHREKKAVYNFFTEQSRIRSTVVRLPGKDSTLWDVIAVCGEVYAEAIKDLCSDMTDMAPGDKGGWIAEYPKARAAIYYSLKAEDRKAVDDLCAAWNRTGLPKIVKKKKNDKSCLKFLRNCAHKLLQTYGVYPFVFAIGEPGTGIKSKMYDFSLELGLGDVRVEDTVAMDDTLAVFRDHVHARMGTTEPPPKPSQKAAKALDKLTAYEFDVADFSGRDGLLLRKDDWDEALMAKQSLPAVHAIFRWAHANISSRHPRDLPPPWKYIADGSLVDESYFPPGCDMKDPNQMKEGKRLELLRHLFFMKGELTFKAWKGHKQDSQPPVDMDMRWWAKDPAVVAFEKARDKALSSTAKYGKGKETSNRPSTGASAVQGPYKDRVVSPYGSTRSHIVHDDGDWLEADFIDPPKFRAIPDPDDFIPRMLPVGEIDISWPAPCLVPENSESRAQWCFDIIAKIANLDSIPQALLKSSATAIVQLPLVRNHFYSARPFRKKKLQPSLPTSVSWSATSFSGPTDPQSRTELETFLRASPWEFRLDGESLFSGLDMVWCFLLGVLQYLHMPGSGVWSGSITYNELKKILSTFRRHLTDLAATHDYPGIGPSQKYRVAGSRQAYLFSVFDCEPQMVELLRLVQRLPFNGEPANDALSGTHEFPSWQFPRLGLPASLHQDPSVVMKLETWMRSETLFVMGPSRIRRSSETGLAHLLRMACILADLKNIRDERWDELGQLEVSRLRGHEERLLTVLEEVVDVNITVLQEVLGEEEGVEAVGLSASATSAEIQPPHPQRKKRGADRPPLDSPLMRAAQNIPKDRSVLDTYLTEATAGPTTAAEERQQIAFELHAREKERMAENAQIRKASRAENLLTHRAATKPPAEGQPLTLSLPALPEPMEFTITEDDDAPITSETMPAAKRKRPRQYHQPLKRGTAPPPQGRTKPQTTAPRAKRQQSKKPLGNNAPKPNKPKKKLPKPSERKRAATESGQVEDDTEVQDGFEKDADGHTGARGRLGDNSDGGGAEVRRGRTQARIYRGVEESSDEEEEDIDLNDDEDDDEESDLDAPVVYNVRPTKRRRIQAPEPVLPPSRPTTPTGGRHRTPSRQVEVLLPPMRFTTVTPEPARKPRPKPILKAGSRAAVAAALNGARARTRSMSRTPMRRTPSAGGEERADAEELSNSARKSVHFDTDPETPRRSSRLHR